MFIAQLHFRQRDIAEKNVFDEIRYLKTTIKVDQDRIEHLNVFILQKDKAHNSSQKDLNYLIYKREISRY